MLYLVVYISIPLSSVCTPRLLRPFCTTNMRVIVHNTNSCVARVLHIYTRCSDMHAQTSAVEMETTARTREMWHISMNMWMGCVCCKFHISKFWLLTDETGAKTQCYYAVVAGRYNRCCVCSGSLVFGWVECRQRQARLRSGFCYLESISLWVLETRVWFVFASISDDMDTTTQRP